jgi:hydrogenase expression/formation protein HypC
MCLAVPGKILSLTDNETMPVARVDFGGVERSIHLAFTPHAKVGDYVLVHVGVAIQVLDPARALNILSTYEEDHGP